MLAYVRQSNAYVLAAHPITVRTLAETMKIIYLGSAAAAVTVVALFSFVFDENAQARLQCNRRCFIYKPHQASSTSSTCQPPLHM